MLIICSVAYRYVNLHPYRGLYQYKWSYWHHTFSNPSHCMEIHRVGDSRRTVNTSDSPHIPDQLGAENACQMLIYCHDMRSGLN